MCTINKSAHTKKSGNLFNDPRNLERAAAGIGLSVNADKTEYTCFNQRDDISTLKSGPLKLVEKFAYLGSSVSSTATDVNTRQAKAWTVGDSLSVIWKSDPTDKIKRSFFQAAVVSILLYGHPNYKEKINFFCRI